MSLRIPIILAFFCFLYSCRQPADLVETVTPANGKWLLVIDLGEQLLPVDLQLSNNEEGRIIEVRNADERIPVSNIVINGDSLTIRMPLFDSEFKGIIESEHRISGVWTNHLRKTNNRLPFVATHGVKSRFPSSGTAPDVQGKWAVSFSPDSEDQYPAIGLFEQDGNTVTGTFLTETGDYRYLQGVAANDSILLSCFDGSHAFLFKGKVHGDSIHGMFWSGAHWSEPWSAYRNADAELTNPDSLTFLKEGYDMVDFSFRSTSGNLLSPKDEFYKNKVLLVQVMGTWCPNCIDETRLLSELYGKYNDQGLEVIALAFEKGHDKEAVNAGLKRFKESLGIQYDIAYAGFASKDSAAAKLPFLNHVMSYPTCIVIGRDGMVKKIRTGFSGPGTGDHYAHYKAGFEDFLVALLE